MRLALELKARSRFGLGVCGGGKGKDKTGTGWMRRLHLRVMDGKEDPKIGGCSEN